jgi:hypothetical protein
MSSIQSIYLNLDSSSLFDVAALERTMGELLWENPMDM